MSDTAQISRFQALDNGEEFLSADGRRYIKVTTGVFGGDETAVIPSHVAGHDEPDPAFGERSWQPAWNAGDPPLARRDFTPDELVIRDAHYGAAPERTRRVRYDAVRGVRR